MGYFLLEYKGHPVRRLRGLVRGEPQLSPELDQILVKVGSVLI
jgi:hypothetical protein